MAEGIPRGVLLLGIVVLSLCFGVAYHWGSVSQKKSAATPLETLRRRSVLADQDAKACEFRRNKLFQARGQTNATTLAELNAANSTHSRLLMEEAALDQRITTCRADLAHQRTKIESERSQIYSRVERLQRLTGQLTELSNDIARVRQGVGMQRALLLDAIHQERVTHEQLMRQLGEPAPQGASYDDLLIAKYAAAETNLTVDKVASEVEKSSNLGEMKVSQFLRRWTEFRYDPAQHPRIFIARDDGPESNATVQRPTYFGREPTTDEALGMQLGPQRYPIRTTAFVLNALTAIGLCALRHNNSNLTYPTVFRRVDNTSELNFLNITVETPLVTYCSSCVSAIFSPAFRLACGRDTPKRLYGTYDFWAARSMLRPTQAVIDAARSKYRNLGLGGRNVLAVAFKNPPQLQAKCKAARVPQRHYMWARATTIDNATLFQAVPGANTTEQCQPTRATVFQAIETLRQRFAFDAVLVSVNTPEDEEAFRNAEFGGAAQVVPFRPTTAFDDVVDITLASWADHILVNRFADHSQFLTETFALRHNVSTDGRVHFI